MKSRPASQTPGAPERTAASRPAQPAAKKVVPVVRQSQERANVGTFDEVLSLIAAARQRAHQAVNTELVGLYWELGGFISRKIRSAEWGDGVVVEFAVTIAQQYPGRRGFTWRNLFRMRQFFETYRDGKKVSPLVTRLPWTHHLLILSQTKTA